MPQIAVNMAMICATPGTTASSNMMGLEWPIATMRQRYSAIDNSGLSISI